jgi:hypothetical protein
MIRIPLELQPTLFTPAFGVGKRSSELPCGCLWDNLTGKVIVVCKGHEKKGKNREDNPPLPLKGGEL